MNTDIFNETILPTILEREYDSCVQRHSCNVNMMHCSDNYFIISTFMVLNAHTIHIHNVNQGIYS